MKICFIGGYDANYARTQIIIKGLEKSNVEVIECKTLSKHKFWLRYPILFFRYLKFWRKNDYFIVPAFRHKDVPLAKILSILTKKPLLFDPLVSRYETKIIDWGKAGKNSFQGWWNKGIDKVAFNMADLILADTSAHRDYYSDVYKIAKKKLMVLPVGADEEMFFPRNFNSASNKTLVQFYGSFVPLQGAEYIIKAADIISKKDKNIVFELIGSGQTFLRVSNLSAKLRLKNVVFRDWVSYDELPNIISRADISLGIFSNGEKAFRVVPNKVFQAMAMGKPVITGNTPASRELFKHKKNIYLCENANSKSLAEAILELKNNNELRKIIGVRAKELIHRKYNSVSITANLVSLLRDTNI